MVLGFKDRFVPFVEDGSKTHSIRAGHRWKAGMRADCFARPRQRDMRLLLRADVTKVERVSIYEYEAVQNGLGPVPPLRGNHVRGAHRGPNRESLLIWINDGLLEADEARAFLRRDGFRTPDICPQYEALLFWRQEHHMPFVALTGQLIHWDYERRYWDVSLRDRMSGICDGRRGATA